MTTPKGSELKTNYTKGFTLLEVIAAIFVLTLGISGSFALVEQLLVSASLAQDKLLASYLAQEGVEIVRNIRDTNWLQARLVPATPWDDGLTDGTWELDYTTVTLANTANFEQCGSPGHNCDSLLGDFLKVEAGFYNYDSGAATKFKRKIVLAREGSDELNIRSIVEWQERGRGHKAEVSETITNWYAR